MNPVSQLQDLFSEMMAVSKRDPPKNEPYSSNAYFEMVMNRKVYKAIPDRVIKNPKFWDFLESTRTKSDREDWANDMLGFHPGVTAAILDGSRISGKAPKDPKVIEGEDRISQGSGETLEVRTLEADIGSFPEGGKFQYLKNLFCVLAEEEEQEEDEDEDAGRSSSRDSEPKADQQALELDATTRRGTSEWTEYDSEAVHPSNKRKRVAERHTQVPLAEGEKTWEWTHYDSEAEREEMERNFIKKIRGDDF